MTSLHSFKPRGADIDQHGATGRQIAYGFPMILSNVLLRIAHGARQRELRVRMAGYGKNVVLLRAGQFVLGGDHLNVVGRARLKTVLREFKFALRQILPFLGNGDLFGRGLEIQQRLADILFDAAAQIGDLIVDALDAAGKFLRLAVAIAIKDRKVDLALNQAGALHASDAAANPAVVSVDAELWIVAGAAGALLLDQSLALPGKRKIVGAREECRGHEALGLRLSQGLILERLGQFQRRARTHAQIAREGQQRLLVLVLRHQQSLLVIRQLHLGAQHVNARRGSRIVLVFRQLVQSIRVRHPGLGSVGTRRSRLGIQIEAGNRANDEIARILIIHLASIKRAFAGFPSAITLKIDDVLLRINAKIVVGKRPHHLGHARQRNPESAQIAVLHVGIGLRADPRKQRGRQAAQAGALGFLNPRAGDQHVEVGLQRLLNRILQRQAVRRWFLRGAVAPQIRLASDSMNNSTKNCISSLSALDRRRRSPSRKC